MTTDQTIDQTVKRVELIDYAQNIINRMMLSVDTNSALSNISQWLCDYTKIDADTFFSFKDHEFQIAIVNDINARQCTQKCSQVGATELDVRKALAITMISKNTHVIFGMPTRTLATKTSTTRMKPVIANSPMLSQAQNRDAKGAELLGLGSSFLHIAGTTGAATGAISVPAKYVNIDELDFCDQEVVEMFESRLKHAPEDMYGRKGTMSYRSTPTVEDFGINAKFKTSDQKHYQVHCSCCEALVEDPNDAWFEPDYFRDLVIPGWDKKLIELTPEDIRSDEIDVQGSYMRCPRCRSDVWEDLCDPTRRKWVARLPENLSIMSGWQIHPWDAPKINSIPSVFMAMLSYEKNIANYYNFIVGIPFSDKNNSFLLGPFSCGDYTQWLEKKVEGDQRRFCIGVDVGRTSHISVGCKDLEGKLHIVYLERFKASKNNLLGDRVIEVARLFKSRSMVIDGMPDFSTAQIVAKKFPHKIVLACEYTQSKPKGKLSNYKVDEENNLVSAYRTGVLSDYLNLHNSGDVVYPNQSNHSKVIRDEMKEITLNLSNLKKITKTDNVGEDFDVFIKTGPDHYGHAISYLNIACDVLGTGVNLSGAVAAPSTVLTFKTQGRQEASLPVSGGIMAR